MEAKSRHRILSAILVIIIAAVAAVGLYSTNFFGGPILAWPGTVIQRGSTHDLSFTIAEPAGRVVGQWRSDSDGLVRFYPIPPGHLRGMISAVPCLGYESGMTNADFTLKAGTYEMSWSTFGNVTIFQTLYIAYPANPKADAATMLCDT